MNIAYLITDPGIPVRGGKGASVHVRAITSALADLGHRVRVLAVNPGGDEPWDSRVPLLPLVDTERVRGRWRHIRKIARSRSALSPAAEGEAALPKDFAETRLRDMAKLDLAGQAAEQAQRLLRRKPADIILERLSPFGAAGLILARELKTARVVEMNAPLTEESQRWRKLAFDDISTAFERAALREARGVTVVSEPLADRCRDLGLARDRILLLPNGVDTELFCPGPKDTGLAAELGLTEGRVVGFAGSLKPWHGVDLLLKAFDALAEKDARLRLLVVGDGPERASLEKAAARSGKTERVVFTGAVPHASMPDYFRLMDVTAAPYREEGGGYFSPLKVLEAMACGLSVVASGGGDLTRQIEPGLSGLLVPAGDTGELGRAIGRLLRDPGLRARTGAAARARAELRTWAGSAHRLSTFLAESLEAG